MADNPQQTTHQSESKSQETDVWPGVPSTMAHRASMKWITLESLRVLHDRLSARSIHGRVLLLTTTGCITGTLSDIADHYEDAVAADGAAEIDVASAVTHLRSEIQNVYATRDAQLAVIDNGAIVHVQDAVFKLGGRKLRVRHLALFAADIVGFALLPHDVM